MCNRSTKLSNNHTKNTKKFVLQIVLQSCPQLNETAAKQNNILIHAKYTSLQAYYNQYRQNDSWIVIFLDGSFH
ncbi:MAG: hypothetical protein LBQ66_08150 [Planctomycetaceae bacterium]|nr:hypothetical protein [Planctomycetaceae bacterium]